MKYLIIGVYLLAITSANLSATYFGIWATPFNAFFLIGLEITSRDYLHTKLNHLELILLVLGAGLLSFWTNQDSLNIAIGSSVAVIVSCLLDYLVFSKVKGSWFKRSNISNIFSATSDSLIFPTIAFGGLNIWVTLSHITMKILGGFLWGMLFVKIMDKGR